MSIDANRKAAVDLLELTIGVEIEILSNEYHEHQLDSGETMSAHSIQFQVLEEEPDIAAIGILFSLSLMSFTYAAPRGYSFNEFIPDEEYCVGYFLEGLSFENGVLTYTGDYVSGRCVKTGIRYEPGGKVRIDTRNRGKGADRWLLHLQGKKHLQQVK